MSSSEASPSEPAPRRRWLGAVLALAIVVVAVVGYLVYQTCCAPPDGDGDDVAATTTTSGVTSTAQPETSTTPPPQPTTATTEGSSSDRTFDGAPILTTDRLNVPRLDLLPPQLRDEFDGIYTCEAYDTVELSDGPHDLLECQGSISVPEGRYVVANGWGRDPGQSLDDVLGPEQAMFWLCIDDCAGGMNNIQDPIGYLEFSGNGDAIAAPVYFLDLSGDHVLVGMWWSEGHPIITSVTQVAFP